MMARMLNANAFQDILAHHSQVDVAQSAQLIPIAVEIWLVLMRSALTHALASAGTTLNA